MFTNRSSQHHNFHHGHHSLHEDYDYEHDYEYDYDYDHGYHIIIGRHPLSSQSLQPSIPRTQAS